MAAAKELGNLLEENFDSINGEWIEFLKKKIPVLSEFLTIEDLESTTTNLLKLFIKGLKTGANTVEDPNYQELHDSLVSLSLDLGGKNFTPSETAQFVLFLKDVTILLLIEKQKKNADTMTDSILLVNGLLDRFALITIDAYLSNKERIIKEQASVILEMSTPVVKIWNGIILLPLVGILDSSRAKQMMESLLGNIENYQAKVAIIDISGIPVIDTLVARHLFTTIAAVKLMGSECIVTGISAKISQTIVHLGLDLSNILTRASLEDGLQLALLKTAQKLD
jgi:rsbT co-antagonist protein RsbR